MDQLRRLGHSVDKVEFILMGGTFMSLPADYRDYFIRNLHDSLSGHTSRDVDEAVRQACPDLVLRVGRERLGGQGCESNLQVELE